MDDEYTPTTEDVRIAYAGGWAEESIPGKNAYAEFDRWLAAHDRAVKAEALREAAGPPVSEGVSEREFWQRLRRFLKSRADNIEGASE